MEQIKLLVMTTMLTLLVWVAADSLVSETAVVPASFRVVAEGGNPDVLVSLPSELDPYQLEVIGPRRAVADLRSSLPATIRLQIPDLPSGVNPIALREAIQEQWHEHPRLTVSSVTPAKLPVAVDRMVQRELEISMDSLTLAYDVRPQVLTPPVKVRLRESKAREIAPNGPLPPSDISAEVERLLREQSPGKSVVVLASVDVRPFGPDAAIKPRTVEVQATVAAMRTSAEIPTVPILLGMSFASLVKPIRAVPRDGGELVTQTIRVNGPTQEVARLVRGETRAYGIVQIKDEHLSELNVFKPFTPDFQLPAGIELAEKPKPVELKLVVFPDAQTPPAGLEKP